MSDSDIDTMREMLTRNYINYSNQAGHKLITDSGVTLTFNAAGELREVSRRRE